VSALPIVLGFGVSDATGAAGIQADQLAIASMGCHPASVITGLTTLGTNSDNEWLAVDAEWVEAQARAVLQNLPVAAIKVGALASAEQVRPIAEVLAECDAVPVVLDPLIARADEEWAIDELLNAVRELLMPQATVVTLNLVRARRLIARSDDDERAESFSAANCARILTGWGAEFVLISDAEPGAEPIVNALYDESGLVRSDSLPRLACVAARFHGAGDTLSAALAGMLAHGADMPQAVQEANQYTAAALLHAYDAGLGIAVPNRLFWTGDGKEGKNAG
jgi:hydroxymethylpyrimidine/phosphomethylpyrimidine kinase